MGNYELMFACTARTGEGSCRGTSAGIASDGAVRAYVRVIAVPDQETAHRVAYAMVGEHVCADQTLESVMHVIPTNRQASVARTPDGYYAMWGRVFQRLNIDVRSVRLWYSAEIGLGTNPTGHVIPSGAQCCGEPEIIGFFPWP